MEMHCRRIFLPRLIKRPPRRLYRHQIGQPSQFYTPQTGEIIKTACELVNPSRKAFLYQEFTNLTKHQNADTIIDITELMNKYKITGEELFFAMFTASSPFGMGIFATRLTNNIFTVAQAKKILQEHNYYIDYHNGKPIKNSFRRDPSTEQIIRINKFDDRTYGGCFYKCILEVLDYKISQNSEAEEL